MATMDVFKTDAYSMTELSAAVQELSFVPSFLGDLGIFDEVPLLSRNVIVEKRGQSLALIPASADGSPPKQESVDLASVRNFRSVRLADAFTMYASEIAGFRDFGSSSSFKQVQKEYMTRMSKVRANMDLTHEFHRIGALQGVLLDADGATVIYDWFSEFGIAQAANIDFALQTTTTDVRAKCHQVVRQMRVAGKGSITPQTRVAAVCGDSFYDRLINHDAVKATYNNWQAAAALRENIAYDYFRFGGIDFYNYRGADDSALVAPANNAARFFPVGARDVFKKFMSPADEFMPFVGTLGEDVYAMNIIDKDREAWTKGELYSYPLYMCMQPQVLQRATTA